MEAKQLALVAWASQSLIEVFSAVMVLYRYVKEEGGSGLKPEVTSELKQDAAT